MITKQIAMDAKYRQEFHHIGDQNYLQIKFMAKQIISVRFGNLGFIPSITRKFSPEIPGSKPILRNTIQQFTNENARNNTPKTPNWENSPEAFLCR